ncbi:hypothetical protein B0H16DRAFT_1526984 [Mycena metata]|uniref:Uncharacterized protein n=1 Tax=Mycena metata TaxID=1033252 RepID=A0AAD7NKA6_9AGAR|nr:hypothetical protein B0H16DRAFT_1526984 [Mycena metata]
MSVSTTTDHFFTFGVHRVPAGASAKDFEVNVGALMDGLAALPAAKKNLLSLNLLLPNDVTTAHAQTLGLPIPQTSVFIITECEVRIRPPWECSLRGLYSPQTMNHQAEFFKDAEVQRLIVAADHWGFRTNSCVFSADIVTRIEASALNDGRILWVGYFRVPADMPAFEEKMEAFIEKCVASSAFQKNIVKHTTVSTYLGFGLSSTLASGFKVPTRLLICEKLASPRPSHLWW